MNAQEDAVLGKGKPGVIRGRKANGSASADGRVADRVKCFFNPISGNRDGVFLCPSAQQDSAVLKKSRLGGDLILGETAPLRADHLHTRAALPTNRNSDSLPCYKARDTPWRESGCCRALSAFFQCSPPRRPCSRAMSSISGRNTFSGRLGRGNRWLSPNGVDASFRL